MVDRDLLERVLRLDDDVRHGLRDAIDASLPLEGPAGTRGSVGLSYRWTPCAS